MQTVQLVKYGLVTAAALLTVWLFMSAKESTRHLKLSFQPVEVSQKPTLQDRIESVDPEAVRQEAEQTDASSVLVEPRYTGRDAKGQSWMIEAKTAAQSRVAGEGVLNLTTVQAQVTDASGKNISFTAGKGAFNQGKNQISLEENVRVTGLGYVVTTPKMDANLDTRDVSAEGPVVLQSLYGVLQGKLTGGWLSMRDNGRIIRMGGGVKGRFEPAQRKGK